jgi:uncharacterized membrane protein
MFTCVVTLVSVGIASAQDSQQDSEISAAEETASPLDESGRLVRFERDIAPILRAACLECHGPEDAKNDFRVDDPEVLMDYIEPEDIEASSMFIDYLTVDDEDMLMPPESHGGPLKPGELALIRVWIEEGANWPEGYQLVAEQAAEAVQPIVVAAPQTLFARVWAAQGFLHPATVHFPIALFLLGGGFVVLGWKWPSVGTQVPLACLLLGALSAIAATVMGWSFAPEQGFGNGWNILDWDREIDVHRWSGLIVTIVSSIVAIIALVAIWKDSESLTKTWKIGLLVCAGMVGAVGHQGGELSYGADFYPKAWRILTGDAGQATPTSPPIEATADANAAR